MVAEINAPSRTVPVLPSASAANSVGGPPTEVLIAGRVQQDPASFDQSHGVSGDGGGRNPAFTFGDLIRHGPVQFAAASLSARITLVPVLTPNGGRHGKLGEARGK